MSIVGESSSFVLSDDSTEASRKTSVRIPFPPVLHCAGFSGIRRIEPDKTLNDYYFVEQNIFDAGPKGSVFKCRDQSSGNE